MAIEGLDYIVDGTESSEEGYFELDGKNRDFTIRFQPVIVVYHQCGQLKRKVSSKFCFK